MVSPRKRDTSGKKASKLYVEPAELARKLIKELEGTKMSRGGRTWVRDQYTIFLCREDFARLRSHLDQLVRKLESHMERHVQNKRYATGGALTVELTMDPDLKPGYFGVLAEGLGESEVPPRASARPPQGQSIWDVPEDESQDEYEDAPMQPRQAPPMPPKQSPPLPDTPVAGDARMNAAASQMPQVPPQMPESSPQIPESSPQIPQVPPRLPQEAPVTPLVPPATTGAAPAMPAAPATPAASSAQTPAGAVAEPLVLKVNGQERVFPQGKAVVGRSRDTDLQIDSNDVSRRHALIYCSEGSVVVKDLGSTNGTMVNGYPVDTTVVRPSDVIRIGNAHITAAPR